MIITDRLGLESAYNTFAVHRALSAFVKGVHAKLPDSLFALTTFAAAAARAAAAR